MWKGTQWARNQTPNQQILPPLRHPTNEDHRADSAEEKAELFLKTFFPPPTKASLEDIDSQEYPDPISLNPITRGEIKRAIEKAPLKKAPGNDAIPNQVLKLIYREIAPVLYTLFNSSLHLGYYPKAYKESITIILKKPGKDNYSSPKAYRPIALLNTLGKLQESIIANRIMALAEIHDLLPTTHGRQKASIDRPRDPLSD